MIPFEGIEEGDVIEWEYNYSKYIAKVDAILEEGFGVHVYYHGMGYSQDIITPVDVVGVYRK